MKFQDKSIKCSDCGDTFTFTADEQESAPKNSADEPKRCASCRAARKMGRYGDGDHGYRSRSWR